MNLLSVVALVGFLYFVSQHLQLVLGLSPMVAGLALVPGMAAMIVAGLTVVPISRRVPPHVLIPAALVFSVAGYLIVAFTTHEHGVAPLILAFVVLGIGIGAAETISNELILSSAPAAKAGAASAVSETAYELGAVLGTAILGGIITAFYRGALVLPRGFRPRWPALRRRRWPARTPPPTSSRPRSATPCGRQRPTRSAPASP